MSEPREEDWERLKRFGRYLSGRKRVVTVFGYQGRINQLNTYVDTDYAGCRRTRKSTTGGVTYLGEHIIKSWSVTQSIVTLSSGEAEYYGLVKGAAADLGHQAIMSDYGVDLPVRLWTDSSAAIGITKRSGLGKIRHLATHTLWLQEKVRTKAVEVRKVRGEDNPADLLTKHLASKEKVHNLVKLFGCEYREGRSAAAPLLRPMEESNLLDSSLGGRMAKDSFSNTLSRADLACCELPIFSLSTSQMLPHLYSEADIDHLFPLYETEPEDVFITGGNDMGQADSSSGSPLDVETWNLRRAQVLDCA